MNNLKQHDLDVMRCCCALALKNGEIREEESKVLYDICKERGLKKKYVTDIISALQGEYISEDYKPKNNKTTQIKEYLKKIFSALKGEYTEKDYKIEKGIVTRIKDYLKNFISASKGVSIVDPKTEKARIKRIKDILHCVFRIVYADYKVTDDERLFFDFICAKMGILYPISKRIVYKDCIKENVVEKIETIKGFKDIIETLNPDEKLDKEEQIHNITKLLDDAINTIKAKCCVDDSNNNDARIDDEFAKSVDYVELFQKIQFKLCKVEQLLKYVKSEPFERCYVGVRLLRCRLYRLLLLLIKEDEISGGCIKKIERIIDDCIYYIRKIEKNQDEISINKAQREKLNLQVDELLMTIETEFKVVANAKERALNNDANAYETLDDLRNRYCFKFGIDEADWKNIFLYDVNVGIIGDYSRYVKAAIKIDRDNDESSQSEFEKFEEINKLHGKDLERYIDFISKGEISNKEKARIIFDFIRIILADNRLEQIEDLMFKVCAIIYNINGDEYLEIKKVLYEYHADIITNGKFLQKKIYINKIEHILGTDNVFLKSKRARFSLVCSMSLVDEELKAREKAELYDIGLREYMLPEKDIESIINDLYGQSYDQYLTEMLVNIPKNNSEKLKDLRNCLRIIYSDDEITDAERNAFEIVCLFYGVDKEFFLKSDRYKKRKTIPNKYLTEVDEEKRVKIDREAYEKIEYILKNKQLKGPLCGGVQYALDKRYNEYCRRLMRSDRITTRFSFVIFLVSAFMLLIIINHHGLESFEKNKYRHQLTDFKQLMTDTTYFNAAVDNIAESFRTKAADSLASCIAIDYIVSIDSGVNNLTSNIVNYELTRTNSSNEINNIELQSKFNKIFGSIDDNDEKINKLIKQYEENITRDSVSRLYLVDYYLNSVATMSKMDTLYHKKVIRGLYSYVANDSSTYTSYKNASGYIIKLLGYIDFDSVKHHKTIVSQIDSAVMALNANSEDFEYRKAQALNQLHKQINEKGNLFLAENGRHMALLTEDDIPNSNEGDDMSVDDSWWKSICHFFEEVTVSLANFFTTCNESLSSFAAFGWILFITVIGIVISPIRRFITKFLVKHNLVTIVILLCILLAISGELRTSVLLLSTMLSIEWLILMREKDSHTKKDAILDQKKSHSSLLAILVVMAILADISFGMIELEQLYTLQGISDKVFSALFLGCICFFVGKFMEMQYLHNIEDKKKMQEALEKISTYVKNDKQEEVISKEEISIHCP